MSDYYDIDGGDNLFDFDDEVDPFAAPHIPSCTMFNDDSENDTDNTQNQMPSHPIQIENTRRLKGVLAGNIAEKVLTVLPCMDSVGLNLPLFLDFLSWGDQECIVNAKIRYECTALMVSKELPGILECWRSPPRASCTVMEEFAFSCVGEVVEKELQGIQELAMCPSDEVSDSGLTRFLIKDIVLKLSSPALGSMPKLCEQDWKHMKKLSDLVILSMIFQLMYARLHHHNCWQKFLTTFLCAQGISAKSLDLLHAFGLTMSRKWSVRAFTTISANALEKVHQQVRSMPFVISHDNMNIAFCTFSQRLNKQSHFDSGTARTVYFQPNATLECPLKHPLTVHDIFQLETKNAARQRARDIHQVLQYLVKSPESNFQTYQHKDHDVFLPPAPIEKILHGPQSISEQHILGKVHIEEASYEGNDQLIMEWFKQLNLHTTDERKCTGLEHVIVWVGDQLAVERLRPYIIGWFHLMMAFASSMHKQYLGINAGRGLMHAFTMLERKCLHTVQMWGPFHQQLHEAIYHVTEAHIRDCWRIVSWTKNLADLRQKKSEDLYKLATEIVNQLSSSNAVEWMDLQPEDERDEILRQAILWNRIGNGDVRIMEQTLPYLLFRLLAPGVKGFCQAPGWLMKLTGRPNGFFPIDHGQEHNIRDIKVTHQVQGPNASWDLMKCISPAIQHLRKSMQTLRRGSTHTDPAKKKDIEKLEGVYHTSEIHVQKDGRHARAKADHVEDIVSLGAAHLFSWKTMQRWWEHQNFARSTLELWEAV
ncbi:hypothetical protein BKA82DRAFT_4331999 [Pisolithus tinctorius]|nr:hypothetical protein BKA82DRAFT_4331999 [Pisolithus tinctorius]